MVRCQPRLLNVAKRTTYQANHSSADRSLPRLLDRLHCIKTAHGMSASQRRPGSHVRLPQPQEVLPSFSSTAERAVPFPNARLENKDSPEGQADHRDEVDERQEPVGPCLFSGRLQRNGSPSAPGSSCTAEHLRELLWQPSCTVPACTAKALPAQQGRQHVGHVRHGPVATHACLRWEARNAIEGFLPLQSGDVHLGRVV